MNKISSKELFVICFSLCITIFPAFGTAFLLNYGKNASIISVIFGFFIGFIPLLLLLYISKHLENENIFELNKRKFGIVGLILNILMELSIIYIGFVTCWGILNFVISQLLTRTSYYLLAIIAFSIVSIAVMGGIEIIGRSTIILSMFLVFILLFVYIFLFPEVELQNFLPVFNVSKGSFLLSSLSFITFSICPLISMLSIKKNDIVDKKNYNKAIVLSYVFSTIIIIVFLVLIIGIFGIDLATFFSYPEYYLFKKIDAFDFIQRVENVTSVGVLICFYACLCAMIYFSKSFFLSIIKFKKKKHINILVFILSLWLPILSIYVFKNYHVLFLIDYYPYIALIVLITILLNAFLLFVTRKKLV